MARRTMAWKELRVGILAILSFVILAAALVLISGGRGLFTPKYTLKTHLSNASGLRKGSLVWLAGVEVGSVDEVRISRLDDPDRAVEVVLRIEQAFQDSIRQDSEATLGSIGLLGDKYVEVSRGSPASPVIPENGEIVGSSPADIKKIIQNTNDVMANSGDLVERVTEIVSKINVEEGTLGKLINDPTIFNNLADASKEFQDLVVEFKTGEGTLTRLMLRPEIYEDVRHVLHQVQSIVGKVDSGEGTLGRLVNDPSLYDRAEHMMARVDTVVQRIEQGEGLLGRLSTDDSLYIQLEDSLQKFATVADKTHQEGGTIAKLLKDPSLYYSLDEAAAELVKTMHDFRQNPKKYLRLNVFSLF